jgi:hypothetical protein
MLNVKNTKQVKRVADRLAQYFYIMGGSITKDPLVRGMAHVDRYLYQSGQTNVVEAKFAIVDAIKRYRRNWTFWAALFYYDPDYDLKQHTIVELEPLFGNSKEIDERLSEFLRKTVEEESNKYFVSVGYVAIPSDRVEITPEVEEFFISLFEEQGFYNPDAINAFKLANGLK